MTRSLPVLSPAVLSTCRTYWRKGRNGKGVADDCCKGCPLMGPGFAFAPTTFDGISAHVNAVNAAAARGGGL